MWKIFVLIEWKQTLKIIMGLMVNSLAYIRTSVVNHHQFMKLLKEIEDNGDLSLAKRTV